MGALDKLEASLGDVFEKNLPKLPQNARKSLAKAMWIIALVFGVIQLYVTYQLWRVGHYVDQALSYLNSLSSYYGGTTTDAHLGLMYWVALLVLAADAVLLLLATPSLKAFKKAGWNLLFYGLLLNLAYGVFRMFADVGGGVSYLFGAVIGSAIGAYFLFQVRGEFKGGAKSPAHDKK